MKTISWLKPASTVCIVLFKVSTEIIVSWLDENDHFYVFVLFLFFFKSKQQFFDSLCRAIGPLLQQHQRRCRIGSWRWRHPPVISTPAFWIWHINKLDSIFSSKSHKDIGYVFLMNTRQMLMNDHIHFRHLQTPLKSYYNILSFFNNSFMSTISIWLVRTDF